MYHPNLYIDEFFTKSHQEELLQVGVAARRLRELPPRQRRVRQRPWHWRLRGGLIAFGLRHHARRQRLARRHYATDWRTEVHAIITRDDEGA